MSRPLPFNGVLSADAVVSTLESRFAYDDPTPFTFGALSYSLNESTDTEIFNAAARRISRELCLNNPFAINALENRVNYVVGFGHKYQATPRYAQDAELAQKTQDIVVDFIVANDWFKRQQEILRRYDRDGEVFLRFFRDDAGKTVVRFVEPEQVKTPQGHASRSTRCGIVSDNRDAERIRGYWIDDVLLLYRLFAVG